MLLPARKSGNSCFATSQDISAGCFFTPGMMATLPVQKSSVLLTACPFCEKSFKRHGNHLAYCKERQGRDYSAYLSKKTLDKRSTSSKRSCPKCHRMFLRLDTHLKNGATCRNITQPLESGLMASVPDPPTSHLPSSQHAPSIATPETPTTPTPTPTQQQCLNTIAPVHPGPQPKPLLKLPSSQQEWTEANTFFSEVLVPEVLRESTPESKNRVLCEGIYGLFAQKYGTRNPGIPKQQKKRERHERALKRVKQLKKEARKDFRRAKEQGLPTESILMLARTSFKLVHEHSHLK